MSLGNILPNACFWTVRAAGVGLGLDLFQGISRGHTHFDNTKVQLVAGVAITALAILFGNQVALGAFTIHAMVSLSLLMRGNSGWNAEEVSIRAAALLFGAILGSA